MSESRSIPVICPATNLLANSPSAARLLPSLTQIRCQRRSHGRTQCKPPKKLPWSRHITTGRRELQQGGYDQDACSAQASALHGIRLPMGLIQPWSRSSCTQACAGQCALLPPADTLINRAQRRQGHAGQGRITLQGGRRVYMEAGTFPVPATARHVQYRPGGDLYKTAPPVHGALAKIVRGQLRLQAAGQCQLCQAPWVEPFAVGVHVEVRRAFTASWVPQVSTMVALAGRRGWSSDLAQPKLDIAFRCLN